MKRTSPTKTPDRSESLLFSMNPLLIYFIPLYLRFPISWFLLLFFAHQYQEEIYRTANLTCQLPVISSTDICAFVVSSYRESNAIAAGSPGLTQLVAESAHLVYIPPTLEDTREALDELFLILKGSNLAKREELIQNVISLRAEILDISRHLPPFLSDVLGAHDQYVR